MSEDNKTMEVDSESDSDSSDDGAEEKKMEILAEELENVISSDKYQYDYHVQLVELYRKLSDLTSMRLAYERFHEVFPLTPALWLAWINDEIKVASSDEEKKDVLNLFKKAVEDYASVQLWQEYAQHSLGFCAIADTREILNNGLRAVGLHAAEGQLLWDTLREVELAHLSILEQGTEKWKEQLEKVGDAFKRQLSVPLMEMDSTYEEFKVWLESLPSDHGVDVKSVDWRYKKALEKLKIYKPFEERLLAEDDSVKVFGEYIDKAKDNPTLIMCLYERAVAQNCLTTTLWEDYCLYCVKFSTVAVSVSARALRNCPWSEELWVVRLKILEMEKSTLQEVTECFEKGIAAIQPSLGIEIWLAFVEYAIRNYENKQKIDSLFEQANNHLKRSYNAIKLADLQGRYLGSQGFMPEARTIWEGYLTFPASQNYHAWREYTLLELKYGTVNQIRSLFQKALTKIKDYPQMLADDWLMFERERGSVSDVLHCLQQIKEVRRATMTYATQDTSHTKQKQESKRDRSPARRDKKNSHTKRALETDNHHPEPSKRFKKTREFVNDDNQEVDPEIRRKHPDRVTTTPVDLDVERTVFVSNLQGETDEKDLQAMFPNAVKIQLVMDRKGASKRYGYIRFEHPETVEASLKRDREPLKERPVFISRCRSDRTQRQHAFKYATTMEKNKLFVKNLPRSLTSDEFEEIFKPYGHASARLVKYKNGQCKGLGFVEFPDEKSANKAMKATHGIKVKDWEIDVAISAPPPKKAFDESGMSDEPIRHSRTKLQTSFIPRGVQLKNKQEAAEFPAGKDEGAKPAPKSNEDFRKMLLNK